ncbi:hypothetical protein LSH36_246g00022 [Paralvinella palmiformis]|uniref:MYND-type domain-containing protein n=1 Tax=Paralvinella palmiformis TaxID=53620 RepID=A0AAD9N4Y6_9ANNE|nr:hypothetical protein LSH36_246g00022 [Paralvinella palmiformis]
MAPYSKDFSQENNSRLHEAAISAGPYRVITRYFTKRVQYSLNQPAILVLSLSLCSPGIIGINQPEPPTADGIRHINTAARHSIDPLGAASTRCAHRPLDVVSAGDVSGHVNMANSDVLRRIRACSRQTVNYGAPEDIRRKYGDGINKTLYHLTSAMLPEELDQLGDNEGSDEDIIDSFDYSPHHASGTDVGGFARRCSKRHLVEDGYEAKLDESFEPRIKSNRNAISDLPKDVSGLGTIDDLWMNEMSFDGEQFPLESLDDVTDSSDESDRNRFYGHTLDTIAEEGSDELDSSVPDMSVDGVPWWKLDELNDSLSPSDCSEQSSPRTPTGEQTRQPIISGTSLSQLDYEPEQPDGGPNHVQSTESHDWNSDGTTDTSRHKHVTDRTNDINEHITDHRQPAAVRLHGGKRNDRILPSIEAKKLYFEANLYCQPDIPIQESGEDADQHPTSDGERQEINGASSPHEVGELRCVPNTDEFDDADQQPTVDVHEDDISEVSMPKSNSVDLANESNFSDEFRSDISDVQRSRPGCGRLPTEQSDLEGAAQIDQSYTEGVYLTEKAPETISRHPGDWDVTTHVTSKMEGFGEKNTDSTDVQPRYSRSAEGVDSERNRRCANSLSMECHESPRSDSTAGDVNWGRKEVEPTNLHHDKPFVKDARRHTNHSCDFANGMQTMDMGGNAVINKTDLNGDYRFQVRKNNAFTFTFPKNWNDNKTQVNIPSEDGVNVEDVPVTSAEIHCSVDIDGYKDGGSAVKTGPRLVTLTSREPGIGDNGLPSGGRTIRAMGGELCDDSLDSVSEMGHRRNQPTNNNNNSCQLTDYETAGYHPAAEQITAVSYSDSDSKPLIKRVNSSVADKLDDVLNQRAVNRMKSGSSEEADADKKVSGREQTLSQNGGTGLIRCKTGNSDSSILSRREDHVGQAAGTCTALATSTALVRKTLEPGLQEPDVATVVSAVARAEVSANNPYIAVARASARAASIATASATKRLTSTDGGSCAEDISVIISTSCTIRGSDDNIREESAAILKAMGDYEQSAVHRFPVTKALTDAATQSTDDGSDTFGTGAPLTKAKLRVTVDNPECTGEGQPRVVRTLECDWPSNGSEAEVTCVVRDALREILETGVSLASMRGEGRQSTKEDVSYRRSATRHDPREDQGRLNKRSITVSTSLDADEGVAAKRKIAAPGACSTPDTGMSTPDSTGPITRYITRAVTSTEQWQLTANSEKFEKPLDQTANPDSHENDTCMDPVDPHHRIGITDSTDKTKIGRQDLKDKAQPRKKESLATGTGHSDQDSLDVELGMSSTVEKRAKKKKKKKKKVPEVGNNVEKSPLTAIEVTEVKKKKSTKKIKGILKNSDLINIDLTEEVAPSGDGQLSTSSTLIRDKNTTSTSSSAVDCGGDRRRRGTTVVPGKSCQPANVNEREPAKPGHRSIPLLERTDFGPRARDPEPQRARGRGLAAAGHTSALQPPVDGDGKVPDEAIDQRGRTSYGEATTRRTGTPKAAHLGEATSGEWRASDQPTAYHCRDRVDSDIVKSAASLIVDNTRGQLSERRTGREQCGQEPCGREYRGREQCEKEHCREVRLGQEQCGTEQCGVEQREREQYGAEQRVQEKCIERRTEEQREKEQEHLAPEQRGQEQRGQEQRTEEQLAEVHCKQVCGQEKCSLAKCDQKEHQQEQLVEEDHELEQRQQRDCVRGGQVREDRRHDLILIDIDIDEGRRQRPDYEKLKKRLLQAKPKPPPAPYSDSVWNAGQLIAAQSRDRALTRGSDPDDPYGIYGMLSETETQDSIRKSKSLGILPSQLVESGVVIAENDPYVTNQADRMSAFYVTDLDTTADRSKSMFALPDRSSAHGSATYREGSRRIVEGDNNTGQPLSENEARISRSLSKLSIPDWFMTSPRKDQEIVILRNANARHMGYLDQDKRAWYVTSADTQGNRITSVSPKPVVIHNWISSSYRASRGSGSRTPSPGPRPEQTFELPSSRLRSRSRERPKPVPVKALHEIQIPSAEGAGRKPAKEAYLRLRERSKSREANQTAKEKPDMNNYFENRTNHNGHLTSDGTIQERNHQELQHRQSRSRLPYSERHRDDTSRIKSDKRTSPRQPQSSTTRPEVRRTANTSPGDCLLKDSGLGSSSSSSPRPCDENSNQTQNRAMHVLEEPIYVNVPFVYQQVNGAADRQPFTPNGQDNGNTKVGSSSTRIDHRTDKEEPRDRNEIDAAQVSNNKDVVQNGYSDIRKKEDPGPKNSSDDSKPWYEEDEESVQKDKITGSVPMDILSLEVSPGSRRLRKNEANDVPSAGTNQSERKTKSPKKAAKPPGKVRNQTKHGLSSTSKTPKEIGSFENLLDGLLVLDSPPTSMIGQQKKTRSTTSLTSKPMADRLERALQLLKHPLDYQWGSTNEEETNSPLLPRADDVHNPVCLGSGHSEIIVKCRNKKCRKAATLDEARNGYKTCHNCYTYYCSRECRKDHWARHKRRCLYSRISSACKRVARLVHDDPDLCGEFTRIARAGYLSRGRGCVLLAFASTVEAERFIRNDPNDDDDAAPAYASIGDIQNVETMGEHLFQLTDTCRSYNPELKYVLNVAIIAGRGDIQSSRVASKRECSVIQLCYKLRLSTAPSSRDPTSGSDADTLILTAMPGSEFSENLSGKKAREICFINIQRKLRQRGVSLRHQHPEVYSRLCAYVAENEHFTPITIFPMDTTTGRRFMCLIMPDSEPEMEWIERNDLLEQLGLSTAV